MHFLNIVQTIKQRRESLRVTQESLAELPDVSLKALNLMRSQSELVEKLTFSSFFDESTQRNYWQSYQDKLKQMFKE